MEIYAYTLTQKIELKSYIVKIGTIRVVQDVKSGVDKHSILNLSMM